jgi:hypothetical protein
MDMPRPFEISQFEKDPFYLLPLNGGMLETHFVNREKEREIVNSILGIKFEDSVEICAVVGGTGIGKSSLLEHYNDHQEYYDRKNGRKKRTVIIIDNVDKLDEDRADEFYARLSTPLPPGGAVFFSDTYERSGRSVKLRRFAITQTIALPQQLGKEQLELFLQERVKNCLPKGTAYEPFFTDDAMEALSIRSRGNLRNFFDYAKHAWVEALASKRDTVSLEDASAGIINIDKALLGGCDLVDMKILWFATVGTMNKALLANRCDVNYRTLESHIENRLEDVIIEDRNKKEIALTSVYRNILNGENLLREIIKGLGFHMSSITGTRE